MANVIIYANFGVYKLSG